MTEDKTHFLISIKNFESGRGAEYETIPMTEQEIISLYMNLMENKTKLIFFECREKGIIGSGRDKYFHKRVCLKMDNIDEITLEVAPVVKIRQEYKYNAENL